MSQFYECFKKKHADSNAGKSSFTRCHCMMVCLAGPFCPNFKPHLFEESKLQEIEVWDQTSEANNKRWERWDFDG